MLGRVLIIFVALLYFSYAGNGKSKVYTIVIEAASTKSGQTPWDIAGGAPDIKLIVDGEELIYDKKCHNKYRCEMFFSSDVKEWYFEILDKDIKESDLIGKGKCSLGKECTIGFAKVKVEEKK